MKNNAVRPPFGGKVAYRTFTLVLLFLFLCTTIFIQTPLDVQALEPAGQLVTLSSLPEGVYAIRTMNTTDGGKYMTVQGSDPTLGDGLFVNRMSLTHVLTKHGVNCLKYPRWKVRPTVILFVPC